MRPLRHQRKRTGALPCANASTQDLTPVSQARPGRLSFEAFVGYGDEVGRDEVADDLVSVAPDGLEAQADWENLQTPETYLGYQQAERFAASGGAEFDEPFDFLAPDELALNQWALSGDWTIGSGAAVLNGPDGRVVFRFHARDVHLVMGPPSRGTSVPFRVLFDGEAPGDAHGDDVDEQGSGTLMEQRLYQLIRQPGPITDRTFEIAFEAPGAEAYAFTFG